MSEDRSTTGDSREQWETDRTTFQRIDDVLVGTHEPASPQQFADRADCSENGARRALDQLAEMGIADRIDTRPTTYQRNPSYFCWKRIEQLAREHSVGELRERERVAGLIEDDTTFQEKYDVPDPDAVVVTDEVDDHEQLHERWDDLTEWRTLRRDIAVLKREVQRTESMNDERARA